MDAHLTSKTPWPRLRESNVLLHADGSLSCSICTRNYKSNSIYKHVCLGGNLASSSFDEAAVSSDRVSNSDYVFCLEHYGEHSAARLLQLQHQQAKAKVPMQLRGDRRTTLSQVLGVQLEPDSQGNAGSPMQLGGQTPRNMELGSPYLAVSTSSNGQQASSMSGGSPSTAGRASGYSPSAEGSPLLGDRAGGSGSGGSGSGGRNGSGESRAAAAQAPAATQA
ncbi:hypothetical protein Agub_g2903 [Astrephomene gubernaculifera]|uniref:Uncharacterized protein n=1 Tax=Astrephomene gubernaculifera TaxID=47775 RepID=A0AAD3DK20_9CHLO|nr:hypothetical protein Agub_g2903 [Astrephomene gubernaculifera]